MVLVGATRMSGPSASVPCAAAGASGSPEPSSAGGVSGPAEAPPPGPCRVPSSAEAAEGCSAGSGAAWASPVSVGVPCAPEAGSVPPWGRSPGARPGARRRTRRRAARAARGGPVFLGGQRPGHLVRTRTAVRGHVRGGGVVRGRVRGARLPFLGALLACGTTAVAAGVRLLVVGGTAVGPAVLPSGRVLGLVGGSVLAVLRLVAGAVPVVLLGTPGTPGPHGRPMDWVSAQGAGAPPGRVAGGCCPTVRPGTTR